MPKIYTGNCPTGRGFTKKQLKSLGRKEGLSGKKLEVFADFITRRFPCEASTRYIREWADRFMTGRAMAKADSESRRVLTSAAKLHGTSLKLSVERGWVVDKWGFGKKKKR